MRPYVSERTTTLKNEIESVLKLRPREAQIESGYLERVLENKRDPKRKYLVWHNQYYGQSFQKTTHARFAFGTPGYLASQPGGSDDVALFLELDKLINLPNKNLRSHMKQVVQT
ncbi:MAG: hypothetical protein FWE26_02460 [Coriobacteriia bacterium]|nr:hypothetical protein [Coriobacteriia bacterium]